MDAFKNEHSNRKRVSYLNGVCRGGGWYYGALYHRGGFRTSGYALTTVYVRLGFR